MDADTYVRFALTLVFVLGLIVAIAWMVRRFGLIGRLAPNTGRSRRLAVVEVLPLDPRHKLVLLRRDASEHLLLLGPGHSLVVEQAIAPAGSTLPPLGEPARTGSRP